MKVRISQAREGFELHIAAERVCTSEVREGHEFHSCQ